MTTIAELMRLAAEIDSMERIAQALHHDPRVNYMDGDVVHVTLVVPSPDRVQVGLVTKALPRKFLVTRASDKSITATPIR